MTDQLNIVLVLFGGGFCVGMYFWQRAASHWREKPTDDGLTAFDRKVLQYFPDDPRDKRSAFEVWTAKNRPPAPVPSEHPPGYIGAVNDSRKRYH